MVIYSPLSAMRRLLSACLQPFSYFYYQQRYYQYNQGVRVLMYHRINISRRFDQLTVSPQRFDEHMAFLAKNYHVISLEKMLSSDFQADSLDRPLVVLTFDDGYLDNLTQALPTLIQYQLPATIFVTTDFCEQTRQHPRYPNSKQRLHLNWEEIQQLQKNPLITIGSHTCQHPNLPHLSSAQSWHEVNHSREILMEKLGKAPDFFCYPSGYLTGREIDHVRKAGYQAAVTVENGLNHSKISKFELKRTEVTDKDSITDLKRKLNGAFDLPHQYLHWQRTRMNK